MKNIAKIFLSDYRRLSTNVVAVVIIMGLAILPSLYAWFNIMSNWDPYSESATSALNVAVATEDTGTNIGGIDLNVGEGVIDALKQNKTIGWIFCDDKDQAIEGVNSGEYYAALIIPDGFSTDILSFMNGDPEHSSIDYYVNEKKNAIAQKITGKAQTAVNRQINEVFVGELTSVLANATQVMVNLDGKSFFQDITDDLDMFCKDMGVYVGMIDSFDALTRSASDMLGATRKLVPFMENTIWEAERTVRNLNDMLPEESTELKQSAQDVLDSLGEVSQDINSLDGDLDSLSGFLADNRNSLKSSGEDIKLLQQDLQLLTDELRSLTNLEMYDSLKQLFDKDAEAIGDFISSPAKVETKTIYPVENYGSSMASFYTILALWVGALILVAIMHTKVLPESGITNVKHYQRFFGRYATFFVIGQIQTLIVVLGDLFYLRIQCLHPFLFWLAAAVTSLGFTLFIYALTYALGNIGEAIVVILLVIQVAGAGGTYPIEVLPEFYQNLYRFMPFSYCMNAMRETIAGMYETDYWKYIGFMGIFIAVSLIIGLVLRRPLSRIDRLIEKNKEKSSFMY